MSTVNNIDMSEIWTGQQGEWAAQIEAIVRRYYGQNPRPADLIASPAEVTFDWVPGGVAQLLSYAEPHEEDYYIFSHFKDPESLILDVGSDFGYSISSLRVVGCQSRILSFEVNQHQAPMLEEFSRQDGRYDFRITAIGNHEEDMIFAIPVMNGYAMTAWTSGQVDEEFIQILIRRLMLQKMWAPHAPLRSLKFYTFTARSKTIDWLLSQAGPYKFPIANIAAIKIDIEGLELAAAEGAMETIKTYHPLLMVEGPHQIKNFALSLGYQVAVREGTQLRLSENTGIVQNGFFLHTGRLAEYRQSGLLVDA